MICTLDEFIKKLGIENMPAQFGADYDSDIAEYEKTGVPFLTDEYIDMLHVKYGAFPKKYDFVKSSAALVRENDFAACYCFLLNKMLRVRKNGEYIKLTAAPPTGDDKHDLAVEMAPILAQMALIPNIVELCKSRGLPKELYSGSSMTFVDSTIVASSKLLGRDGFEVTTYFSWNQRTIDCRIMRIGILNFEIKDSFSDDAVVLKNKNGELKILTRVLAEYNETDTCYEGYAVDTDTCDILPEKLSLSKAEWSVAIEPDAQIISVHIPRDVPLTVENTEASYSKCLDVLSNYFPEFKPKAFFCASWMLDPQLKNMLSPESRIVAFQNKYRKFPRINNGLGIFKFVFNYPAGADIDLEKLPEDTSLQRSIKKHCLEGKKIYAQCGFFFLDEINR